MRRAKGEGSVTKRKDGRWQARYTANGKRRYIYGRTKSEVARKLNDALHDANRGLVYEDKGITVKQHIGNWLEASRSAVRARTWERYEQICRNHIVPELGHLKLRNLTPVVVQNLYGQKLKVLSPRTVVYVHVTLHKALQQALRWNLIPRNVTELVDPPRITKREMTPLNPEQVKALFRTVEDSPLEALYVLAVMTGLRKGELLGLKWSDVDLDAGLLQVKRSLSMTKEGPVMVPPKTAKGSRRVALSGVAVEALIRHRSRQDALRYRRCRRKLSRLWRASLSSYGEVPKGYWMDESNPELLVLRRKKDGLRLAFFPPERATRIAVIQTVVKDREWQKIERANSKRRRGC